MKAAAVPHRLHGLDFDPTEPCAQPYREFDELGEAVRFAMEQVPDERKATLLIVSDGDGVMTFSAIQAMYREAHDHAGSG